MQHIAKAAATHMACPLLFPTVVIFNVTVKCKSVSGQTKKAGAPLETIRFDTTIFP